MRHPLLRRRRYFVMRGLQLRYMSLIMICMGVTAIVLGSVLYVDIWNAVIPEFSEAQLARILEQANAKLLPKLLLLVLVMAVVSIFVSHRIAGPIYRFVKSVGAICNGDLTVRFALRKGDELKGLAEAFDMMTQSLRSSLTRTTTSLGEISSELDQLSGRSNQPLPTPEQVNMLKRRVDQLKKDLSIFKLS